MCISVGVPRFAELRVSYTENTQAVKHWLGNKSLIILKWLENNSMLVY